ncbi:MAG: serine protease, partial [Chitinophagales bacterium]
TRNGTDTYEGIYQNEQQEPGSPKYRMALKNTGSGTYELIYLSGAAPEDARRWEQGDKKAYLTKVESANEYKVKWYMGDRTTSRELTISFANKTMLFFFKNGRPSVVYEKVFPDKQIVIAGPTEAVPEPVYTPASVNAFLVSASGVFVTQNDMLEAGTALFLRNPNTGEKFAGSIIARNAELNLALIRIADPTFTLPDTMPYNFSNTGMAIGDNVYCLGFNTADTGITLSWHLQNAIVISKSKYTLGLSPKMLSSCIGSPVFDRQGNLIGMLQLNKATLQTSVTTAESIRNLMLSENVAMVQKKLSDVNMKSQGEQVSLLLPCIFIIDPAEVR